MGDLKSISSKQPSIGFRFPVLDTELVIAVCCAIVVATGLFRRHFGAPETLALLGLAFSVRLIAAALVEAWRARLPRA